MIHKNQTVGGHLHSGSSLDFDFQVSKQSHTHKTNSSIRYKILQLGLKEGGYLLKQRELFLSNFLPNSSTVIKLSNITEKFYVKCYISPLLFLRLIDLDRVYFCRMDALEFFYMHLHRNTFKGF